MMNNTVQQILCKKLNTSEQARQKLAPIVARLLGRDSKVGHHVESIFTMFWDLARKADDMIDYSNSTDKRWLEVLQHVFFMCSKAENLPKEIPAKLWLDTISHFFYLMSSTCKGEIDDLLLHKPSLSNYEYMVLQKTGPWFAGRIVCTALAIGVPESPLLTDLQKFGKFVSLAYQIRNDILDIETEQKDLTIGKLNYPSVLLMLNRSSFSLDNDAKISQGLYYSQRTIELANLAADRYEEKAKRIALKYDYKLGQLTLDLCSSR
jgi:polyprenyl synthetase